MEKANIRWVLILVILAPCLACTTGGRTKEAVVSSDPILSGRCAEALAALARSFGAAPSVEGDRVRVGKDELRLRAIVEGENHDPARTKNQYIVGLDVEVSVNGVPQPLTAGSVGIGHSREDARETAVSEWAQFVGVGVLGALGVQRQEGFSLDLGRFSVHPGGTGFRCSQKVPWSAERRRELLDKLKGVIGELERSPSEFHSVSIMLVVETDGSTGGECWVDGVESPEALKAVQSYSWPLTSAAYMFKQFYVLRRLK